MQRTSFNPKGRNLSHLRKLPKLPQPPPPIQVTVPREGTSFRLPKASRGTKRDRLLRAIANDNGGPWFLAATRRPLADIERRFRWGQVGAILYLRVGGMLQGPRGYLYIQLRMVEDVQEFNEVTRKVSYVEVESSAMQPEERVRLCLRELGITVIEACEVQDVFASKRY